MIPEFNRRGFDQLFGAYFDLEIQLAGLGAVDVLAHADLVKKHGQQSTADLSEVSVNLAGRAVASGTLVEVSSAGLTAPCQEIYPSHALLSAFQDAGVGMTTGSDTHGPEGAGWGVNLVADHARKVGYSKRAAFRQRQHHSVGLDAADNPMGQRV
jgi:histidinol-phosphatase (PHP family)